MDSALSNCTGCKNFYHNFNLAIPARAAVRPQAGSGLSLSQALYY